MKDGETVTCAANSAAGVLLPAVQKLIFVNMEKNNNHQPDFYRKFEPVNFHTS